MKPTAFFAIALGLSACTAAQVSAPVPVAVTQDVQTALAAYQAGIGLVQIAVRNNPSLEAKVNADVAKAAPYVAAAQAGATDAATATSLAGLAADLLADAAAGKFTAVPLATAP